MPPLLSHTLAMLYWACAIMLIISAIGLIVSIIKDKGQRHG